MLYYRHLIPPITILLGNILLSNLSAKAEVLFGNQNPSPEEQEILLSNIIQFEPPSGNGDPNSTAAGGSRSSCPQRQAQSTKATIPLTALLPKTTNEWSTIRQRPTLFVYVPPTSATTILFQLKDQEEEIVYESLVPLSASAGQIVDITIPPDAPAFLNIEQQYQWSVFLLCQYNSLSPNTDINVLRESYDLMNEPWVMGSITRINSPDGLNQLTNNLSLDLASAYAQKGLWFETLATIHAMIKEQPQEAKLLEAWRELLESQGLETEITQTELSN